MSDHELRNLINQIQSRTRPIYQQAVIDTYTRVAFAKLYTSKHAITSADVLNHRVIPFFEQQERPILRMLTDRGTEFNGRPKNHEYELYLQLENFDHSKTKFAIHNSTASPNVFTGQYKTSSMLSRSAGSYIKTWLLYRQT